MFGSFLPLCNGLGQEWRGKFFGSSLWLAADKKFGLEIEFRLTENVLPMAGSWKFFNWTAPAVTSFWHKWGGLINGEIGKCSRALGNGFSEGDGSGAFSVGTVLFGSAGFTILFYRFNDDFDFSINHLLEQTTVRIEPFKNANSPYLGKDCMQNRCLASLGGFNYTNNFVKLCLLERFQLSAFIKPIFDK